MSNWDELVVLAFLEKSAIVIDEYDVTPQDESIRNIPTDINPPQERLKFLSTVLLKKKV